MEVTRDLRLDQLSKKKGTAPIRLTFRWENKRLRLTSGASCRPADWNEKQVRVKDKPGIFATETNALLDRWTQAGITAHQEAKLAGQRWDERRMEAEIRVRYERLSAEARGTPAGDLPPLPAVATLPLTLLDYMDQWTEYQATKVSLRSGKPLSKTYIRRLRNLRQQLTTFSQKEKYPISFASMDATFYAKFQHYQLTVLGNEVNTFSGYIKNIKNFLYWCEERDLPVTTKFRRFATPEVYIGAVALTAEELQRWAALDLSTPEVVAYVAEHFPPIVSDNLRGRPALQVEDHRQRLELARDKMLQCCYLGLRISDADKMAPEHIQGKFVKIEAGKTGGLCLIPFIDDKVFKPVALIKKYAPLQLPTCLPTLATIDQYMPHLAKLAGITRLHVTSRIGRKTFATLKIYQGVPKSQVMLATGHTTEKSFNRYLGIDEQELLAIYERTAR
jgi:hypothetical protein